MVSPLPMFMPLLCCIHSVQADASPHRRPPDPPPLSRVDDAQSLAPAPPLGLPACAVALPPLNKSLDEKPAIGSSGGDYGPRSCDYSRRFIPETGVDTEPKAITTPKAGYTDEARATGIEGVVVLRALIAPDGEVCSVREVQGLAGGLGEKAIEAAKMKFEPGKKGGKAVGYWLEVGVGFRLE